MTFLYILNQSIYIYNIMYTQEADFLWRYKAVTHKICMDPSIQNSLITPWKWRIQIRLNNLNICIPFAQSNGKEITVASLLHKIFFSVLYIRGIHDIIISVSNFLKFRTLESFLCLHLPCKSKSFSVILPTSY